MATNNPQKRSSPKQTPANKPSQATSAKTNSNGRSTSKPKSEVPKNSSPLNVSRPRATPARQATPSYEYDVCVSFAGEDREFVRKVVTSLKRRNITCFYDENEQAKLWGQDLYVLLDEVYRKKARYCIMFMSQHYLVKLWTNHERESIQARMFEGGGNYLLPVKLDDTDIPGVRLTLGYIDGRRLTPSQVAAMVQAKIHNKPAPRIAATTVRTDPVLEAEGKKPSAKTLPPVSKKSASRNAKVGTSGKWVLLGDDFFEETRVMKGKDLVRIEVVPKSAREEVRLKTLDPSTTYSNKKIKLAYSNEALHCQVQDLSSQVENGKHTYQLSLKPETNNSYFMDVTVQGLTADEVAEKRARWILLGEKPATGDSYADQHILRGFGTPEFEGSIIAKAVKKHGTSPEGLQKARLLALEQLMSAHIIEHALDLTLGPVTKAGLAVKLEGSRRQQYSNKEPAVIHISGNVPVQE